MAVDADGDVYSDLVVGAPDSSAGDFEGGVAGSGSYANMIHDRLPEIAKLAKDPTDYLADIFAAIFLKVVTKEHFDEMLDSINNDKTRANVIDVLDLLFETVDKWISSMSVDVPYVVAPW